MPKLNLGRYNKFLVAVAGVGLAALTTYFPHVSWEPTVVMALSALGVYQTPNDPPAAA